MRESVLSQDEMDALLQAAEEEEWSGTGGRSGDGATAAHVCDYKFQGSHLSASADVSQFVALHDELCRDLQNDLSLMLNTTVAMRRVSAEQQRYRDFIFSLSDTTYMMLLDGPPLPGTAVVEANLSLMFGVLDLLLGGDGSAEPTLHKPTDVELSLWRPFMDRVLGRLAALLQQIVPAALTPRQVETNPEYARAAPGDASVLVITLDAGMGLAHGIMNFCYPLPMVQAVLEQLQKADGQLDNYYGKAESVDTEQQIADILMGVRLKMDATLGRVWIRAGEWFDLAPGDVIPLAATIDEPISLEIGECRLFRGRLGRLHRHLGIRIEHGPAPQERTAARRVD
jgi:flagellar motor switch protein FliM